MGDTEEKKGPQLLRMSGNRALGRDLLRGKESEGGRGEEVVWGNMNRPIIWGGK